MTPQEKAKELFDLISSQTYAGAHYETEEIGWEAGKKCALITIDEILKVIPMYKGNINPDYQFWQEVKQELEKL